MFHTIHLEPIDFRSNPDLDPRPVNDWHTRPDGSPVNCFELQPRDNKSYFVAAHYDPSRDSLTAKLNLGIPLNKVSLGVTENDPNVLAHQAQRISAQLQDRVASRNSAVASAQVTETVAPSSEPID